MFIHYFWVVLPVVCCNVIMLLCFRWFDGFNWDGLRNRKLAPPIVSKVGSFVFLNVFRIQVLQCKITRRYLSRASVF